jgi:hypothetical protein
MPVVLTVSLTAAIDGKVISSGMAVSNAVRDSLLKHTKAAMHEAANELRAALDKLYVDLAKKHGVPWPMGASATTLAARSGAGLRSIKDSIKVTETDGEVSGIITTGKMTVHETGAEITPRKAQYLTVPLTPALNSQGLPLRSRARDWDNTFIATSRRGNLIIFQKQTGGKIIPLYLLKKSVTIRPRLGLGQMFEDMVPYFERKAVEAIERVYNG